MSNKIQASETTAELLTDAGKGHWVTSREDVINAKGKGVLRTYWLQPKTTRSLASSSTTSDEIHTSSTEKESEVVARHERSIDWVVELFKEYIKPILAKNSASTRNDKLKGKLDPSQATSPMERPLDEVQDVIDLPALNPALLARQEKISKSLELDESLTEKLRNYVVGIASLYRDNPFHNFEHAW